MTPERALAEVAASEPGPRLGAFFDVDGTLLAGWSANAVAKDRLRRRDLDLAGVVRSLGASVGVMTGRADVGAFIELTARDWAGSRRDQLDALGQRLYAEQLCHLVYPEARALVAAHLSRGHTVALTSSALELQVRALADDLGVDNVLCSRLRDVDGIVTGELEAAPLWGQGKADAVQRFAAERQVALSDSWFYADGDEDTGLMHLVGRPRPTNPRRRMARVAARRGWPTLHLAPPSRLEPKGAFDG